MVRRYRSVNDWNSNLNGAVTAGATSWTVDDGSGLPSEGDFFITAGSEIVLVTHRSGNVLTVIRGQEDTTAAAHNDGTLCASLLCAGELLGRMNERGQRKTLPFGRAMTSSGTILTSSDFTLRNTGTGVFVNDANDGTIAFFTKAHSSHDVSGATRNFGTANDHRITVHFECPATDGAGLTGPTPDYFGLAARQATGGQVKGIWIQCGDPDPAIPSYIGTVRADSRSTFLATPTVDSQIDICGRRDMWFRLEIEWDVVASTDHFRWYTSFDGIHWYLLHTHTFAAGTHQVGIWANNDNGPAWKRFLVNSWYEETLTF